MINDLVLPSNPAKSFSNGDPSRGIPGTVVTAEYLNSVSRAMAGVQAEIVSVVNESKNELAEHDKNLLNALDNIYMRVDGVIGKYARQCFYTHLPEKNEGAFMVLDRGGQIYDWVETPYYKGYRSTYVGMKWFDQQVVPRSWTIDAIGGIFSKKTYAGLYGWAQENGLVVPNASWSKSLGFKFGDVDASNFRVPDLRDVFDRAYGTDADSAKARVAGNLQLDAMQKITGWFDSGTAIAVATGVFSTFNGGTGYFIGSTLNGNESVMFDNSYVARTSSENRPTNVSYYPRLNV